MIRRVVFFAGLCGGMLLPVLAFAATYKNLGFVRNNIWYSRDQFFEGEIVRVYSAIFNSNQYDLEGTVEFFDNAKSIGKSDFFVPSGGRIREVWVGWTAHTGSHKITAKIIKAALSIPGQSPEVITVEDPETGTSEVVVVAKPESKENKTAETKEIKKTKNEVSKDTNTSSGVGETANKIFTGAASVANAVITHINTFTAKSADVIQAERARVEQKIAREEKTADSLTKKKEQGELSSIKKPARQAYLLSLAALYYVFDYKVLFYAVLALVCYFALRLFIRRRRK